MKVHIVMHESFEAPGAIETWAKLRNHEISYTRLYEGDSFPDTEEGIDLLFVMGGPQCPATTKEECPHFDAEKEIQFIRRVIDGGALVLGACLGAQLIGESLGATFEHSPNREIGVFPITLTDAAKEDPIFSKFPQTFLVGHWHGDMPGLTADAKILAFSEGCPRQIVKYSENVYGFQCHFEFNLETIEAMISHCGHELDQWKDLPYIQSREELRKQDYDSFNQLLFQFLDLICEKNVL